MSRCGRRLAALAAAASVAALAPTAACAHSPVEGVGAFYGGLLHPVLVPAHLLAILALGLLLGVSGRAAARAGLLTFVVTVAAGLVAIERIGAPPPAWPLVLAGLAAAVPVVAGRGLPLALATALAAGLGLLIGLDSRGSGSLLAAIGIVVGASLIALLTVGTVLPLDDGWRRIGVRIVGSWIAASTLLVLVLQARG